MKRNWIICGGRDFWGGASFGKEIYKLVAKYGYPDAVVHGGAPGADSLPDRWARSRKNTAIPVRANWEKHGEAADSIREQENA